MSWTRAEKTPTVTLWSALTASPSFAGSFRALAFSLSVTWYFWS